MRLRHSLDAWNALCLLIVGLIVLGAGCGRSASTGTVSVVERTAADGTTVFELDVKNRSLQEVVEALNGKFDEAVTLGPNVDPKRHIENIHIETTTDWLGLLNGFAEGMGHLSVDVGQDEITLKAE